MAEAPTEALAPGDVVWVQPEIAAGREQSARRPALVGAGPGYLEAVNTLVTVVPITRTISRERVVGGTGRANAVTLADARNWLADFLDLQAPSPPNAVVISAIASRSASLTLWSCSRWALATLSASVRMKRR